MEFILDPLFVVDPFHPLYSATLRYIPWSRLPRYRCGNIIDTIETKYSCSLNRTISEKPGYHWYPYSWIAFALITRSVRSEKNNENTYRVHGTRNMNLTPTQRFSQNLSSTDIENKSLGNDGTSVTWSENKLFSVQIIQFFLFVIPRIL